MHIYFLMGRIMGVERTIYEKIKDILEWAHLRDNVIRYDRVVDILCDKDDTVTNEVILEVVKKLSSEGIAVIQEEEEEYTSVYSSNDDFIPADVSISQRPMNVYNLMERLENDEIELEPEFQRNKNLWTKEQQSRLIESLMLKIPIPTFYFNAKDDDKWVVIDGLQRLSTFHNFLVRKDKEKFVGLQYMTDFNGLTFDELPRQYIRRIKETPIVAYTVEKGTPDQIVYNIFQRINTGGLELKPQEMRQALYVGKSTVLIQKLSQNNAFLIATQHRISPDRMADRELVNRFIAFTELDYVTEYRGNIDDFLCKALKLVNQYDEENLGRIEYSFVRVMTYSWKIFGKYAFRKYNSEYRRGPINKALFESWSLVLSKTSDEKLEYLVENRQNLIEHYSHYFEDGDYVNALKAGDQYSVARRIDMTKQVIREIL